MHLDNYSVNFSLLEKILRELGLRKLTNKPIKHGEKIGCSGDTGNSKNIYPHLHLQLEFRRKGEIIVIDPCLLFGLPYQANLTATINNDDEFIRMITEYEELKKWKHLYV